MLKNVLPTHIYDCFKDVNFNLINEIRIRIGSPITVLGSKQYYLSYSGLSYELDDAIIVHSKLIEDIIQIISHNSLYSINDQLIQGYVTIDGIRIGVAGEMVVVDDKIKTLKNITSINIRIPHFIKNCSLPVFNLITSNRPLNTLVISPPGAGKTTFLRDYIYQLKFRLSYLNILVVDERSEITSTAEKMFVGVDVYRNCTKNYAFTNGIRSMKPDVIITDEINIDKDIDTIENALTSGINVVASIHAKSIDDIKHKKAFQTLIDKKLFDRYIVLGFSNGVGTIEGVFNETLKCIYI